MAGIYDRPSFAEYTPLSAQEILMPALMMRERHDQLDEEYSKINDELQKTAFIVQHENDPLIKEQYSNYMNSLNQGMNELIDRGVTSNSRRNLLNLRSRYQSAIQPINSGYQLKLQDIANYNQMKIKDPSYIGIDPSQRSVSDYINNGLQPFVQQGISGALIAKQASDMASNYAKLSRTEEGKKLLVDQFGPQYVEMITKKGFIPGTEEAKPIEDYIRNQIISSNNLSWADANQLALVNANINQGLSSLIGDTNSQYLRDTGREFKMQLALQKQAAKEASRSDINVANVGWSANPREVGINEGDLSDQKKQVDNLEKTITGKDNDLSNARNNLRNLFVPQLRNKIDPIINQFEKGEITESDLNDKVEELIKQYGGKSIWQTIGDSLFGTEVNNYIREYNRDISKGYADWLKDNPNGTKEDYLNDYREDYNYKRVLSNNSYISNDTAISNYQDNVFNNYLNSTNNKNSYIVNDNGDKKKIEDLPKELKSKINNSSVFRPVGINPYNPKVGSPTIDYEAIDEKGEKYYMSRLLNEESNEYKIIKPYSDVIKEIIKPYSINKKVILNDKELTIKKRKDSSGKILYYLVDSNGKEYSLQESLDDVQIGISNLWKYGSQPISKK